MKPDKTLKNKILVILVDVNKIFCIVFIVGGNSNFFVTFLSSLSYFTIVFKIFIILLYHTHNFIIILSFLTYAFQENSSLQGFWSVKYTQKQKTKIANIIFSKTETCQSRSQNLPFIGRVDPYQLTNYQ